MTKSKLIQVDPTDYEAAADFRDREDFKRFVVCVYQTIKNLKHGATYRQLNAEYPNRACWINEAVESLEMSGKIRNVGSVSITRYVIADGKGIEVLPKFSKKDFTARGIEQRRHLWQKY